MIIFEEEYYVQAKKSKEFLKILEEFEKAVKDAEIPFLKDWYFLSKKYEVGHVRNVWILEEQANVDVLWEIFPPPELDYLVTRIWDCMIEGTYRYSFWNKVASM